MDTAQWPVQDIVVKPMEEIVVPSSAACSSKPSSLERKARPQKEQALNCPRCNSTNTKFCYYNNYSLSQPRYFCKTCRRYWTEGGSLRNIPVGGGSRKNKRSSSSSANSHNSLLSSSTPSTAKNLPDLEVQPPLQNPKIHETHDLNLGFSATTHDFKTISELIQVPNFDGNNNGKDIMSHNSTSAAASTSSHHISALELIGMTPRGLNSFFPVSNMNLSTVYSSGFTLPEFKPSLTFSLDGLGSSSATGYGSLQDNSGRLLFPFEDLKQAVNSNNNSTDRGEESRDQQNGADSTGYWNGVLGGGSW